MGSVWAKALAQYEQSTVGMQTQTYASPKLLPQSQTLDRLLEACERHLSVIDRLATRRQTGVKCRSCDRPIGEVHTHR